ncbi:hypothetical protein QAA18_08695 [Luteimonas sp. 8-5]|uniref:hypothetical protein n=1 Tax=Luteimonas sp. 8-5 TaxID=3039387 RepID=UPI002436EEF6|nr:hypothetical protein [Luteimonas sp. 8-5]MDG6348810.1 hypothetical protein [Luteimonas sp. 8-5]
MNLNRIAAAMLLLAVAATAGAQQKGGKKLYCWEENGQRTCGDALPPGAVELARTEINAATGRATGEVGRALTEEEVAAAAEREKQAIADTLAAAAQRRRDMAMVESYATEQDLRNAYGERLALLDDALKASVMGEENLRRSLVTLLGQANNLELAGKPVSKSLLSRLQAQHADLLKQQRIIAEQRVERASLDGELADAVERYRSFKNPDAAVLARP